MDSLTAEHEDYKMFWYQTLCSDERVVVAYGRRVARLTDTAFTVD